MPRTEWETVLCGGCFAFFNFLGKIFRKQLTIRQSTGIIIPVVRHGTNVWGISSAGRALAWHARGHRFDPGILHQKSTVLRRKYGAFLFAEADFWGLHCFACTVFRLLQAVPIQPPMAFHKFGTISASLSSTLSVPSKGRFNGCAGKRATFPINRLRGRVSSRRTEDGQKLLLWLPTISAYKK